MSQIFQADSIILERPLPLFIFPMKIGDHWADTTQATVGTSLGVVSLDALVDAYGTLILPTGSYNALRVRVHIDFGDYQNYRYYFLTATPYVSAFLTALSSTNPKDSSQIIFRATYTTPHLKYDHTTGPIAHLLSIPDSSFNTVVSTDDTAYVPLLNSGDTTAFISSASFLAPSPQFKILGNFSSTMLKSRDSVAIPVVFHPTAVTNYSTILAVQTNAINGTFFAVGLDGKGTIKSSVASEPVVHEEYSGIS